MVGDQAGLVDPVDDSPGIASVFALRVEADGELLAGEGAFHEDARGMLRVHREVGIADESDARPAGPVDEEFPVDASQEVPPARGTPARVPRRPRERL